jgi:hypothetical protein
MMKVIVSAVTGDHLLLSNQIFGNVVMKVIVSVVTGDHLLLSNKIFGNAIMKVIVGTVTGDELLLSNPNLCHKHHVDKCNFAVLRNVLAMTQHIICWSLGVCLRAV